MKICKKCNENLELDKFLPFKTWNGFSKICKECIAKSRREYLIRIKDKIKENRTKINIRKKENNICCGCNKPQLKNLGVCENHWFRRAASNNLKSQKYWKILKEKAEEQSYKCFYSGEKLIIGENMELDHKISYRDNPKLECCIDNVHWVCHDVNVLKSSLSHDEFLKMCELINFRFPDKNK